MAELALKKLEEQLQCSICLDVYVDPKQLQCNHVYCQKCLIKLIFRDQQGQLALTCPICRTITPVSADGVAGQSAFHINHLLEILEAFKKIDDVSVGNAVEGAVGRSDNEELIKHCSEHKEELRLYCECKALICFQCAIKGGSHHNHEYELLEKAFEKYKDEISSLLEPMDSQLGIINKALAQLDARCEEIIDQRETIEADINKSVRQLHELLDVRKTELISQLHQTTQAKLKGLAVQKDQIETTQAQISSAINFMKAVLKSDKQGSMMMIKESITSEIKELVTSFQPNLKTNCKANLKYFISSSIKSLCQNYGKITTHNSLFDANPSRCHTLLMGSSVGVKSIIFIQMIDFFGEPCKKGIQCIESELVSDLTGVRQEGCIQRYGVNCYKLCYTPCVKGRHHLSIKVEDDHINGSPFLIPVTLPVSKIRAPINTVGDVQTPNSIALFQLGFFVVTENSKHCVSIFKSDGKKILSFGEKGSSYGNLIFPCGVAIDEYNNILIADSGNNRIQKFTAEGKYCTAANIFASDGSSRSPYSIAINPCNKKIYFSYHSNYIQVLNSDLTYHGNIGSVVNGEYHGIACDSSGCVYVADSGNHSIRVMTSDGVHLRTIGRHGKGKGELIRPTSVVLDADNLVYVSDSGNCRVSVFTQQGLFVTSFGKKGADVGEFSNPQGLAVDSSGVVYVCDAKNNNIQLF